MHVNVLAANVVTLQCSRPRSTDMEEHWKVLGISGCTTCLAPPAGPGRDPPTQLFRARSFRAAQDAVERARAEAAKGHGHGETAKKILRKEGLLDVHLDLRNPFFELPRADYDCFPMCRLHGMYVGV